MKTPRLTFVALLISLTALAFGATAATAAPGAYRIAIVHANCEPPTKFQAQLQAFPDVALVDIISACLTTPALAQLTPYDMVVSMNEDEYADPVAYGDLLADYVDSGGFVFQYAYDNEEGLQPFGRFESQGYPPFIAGNNPNVTVTLGEFDATSPLMQGVTALESDDNTEPALAPGATLVAKWSDGRNLVAYKGRVVSASAYVGDETPWSGDFGRLTINGLRWLGKHVLSVSNPTGGGTVTGSAGGINCGAVCSAVLLHNTPVTLTATPNKGFAFAGFGGACSGLTCALTLDANKTVSANFSSFALSKRAKLNRKKGTALLTVAVGGPGQLTMTGKKTKRQSKAAAAAGKVKLLIKAKGKAAKALRNRGKVRVRFNVAYTPTGGLPVTSVKSVVLKRKVEKSGR
ncbi:MAG TPA: hypothetical protein VJU14_13340 [Solirubrobacterales bacterium]|nr:hypothetical protein [Solirubrobacterales bacterium]